ncbi:MAG: DUF4340 domain-containing protein [Nitrosomonas sp.]|nr:DUF4340 domain-containing protein [Nitrosomonas sp.]MDP1949539.1 DUF4340 domain-containing protein [Nitrosomonas sp.]
MAYHARTNLVMLVTIAGLAIFLYIKPQSQDPQGYKLSSLSVDAVDQIRIVHQDEKIILKKTANRWYLTEPLHASADEIKVKRLLEILSVRSNHRLPLDDLERFGLDKPNAQLYINQEIFNFGGITPITHEQYVAVGESVYLVSPRYAVMLPSQPVNLVSPRLLPETEAPVRFDLAGFSVSQLDETWVISSDASGQLLSPEEIFRWVQSWQLAVATHLSLSMEKLDSVGVSAEQQEIKISLQNGQSIHFRIQQNEPELILTHVEEGISYIFPNELGKQLLDPSYAGSRHALP